MNVDALEIAVGSLAGGLYLGFQHRATRQTCPTGNRLIEDYLASRDDDRSPHITIDLADCTWVDSTFAGWIVSLHKRLPCEHCIQIANCTSTCYESLRQLRLDRLVEFVQVEPPGDTRMVACAVGEEPSSADLELMLHAHEELAALGGENTRVFAPVVDVLRQELRHGPRA